MFKVVILDKLEQRPFIEEFDRPINIEEVTVKNTILKKGPVPDGIFPEVLVYGGYSILRTIFNILWTSENLPLNLRAASECACSIIDFTKAFDCTNVGLLFKTLSRLDARPNLFVS